MAESASWDLTGTPIVIDDTIVGSNWVWAEAQPWCYGAGTWMTPYVIENVTINGLNATSCITIRSSTKVFIIRNCHLFNASTSAAGLGLDNVKNGRLVKNNVSSSYASGIYIVNTENTTITGNIADDNGDCGIFSWYGKNITVTGNNASGNGNGILFDNSNGSIIVGNNMSGNGCGIATRLSTYNLVENNTANDNQYQGICVEDENTIVHRNTVEHNSWIGIWVHGGQGNTISNNNISYNINQGLMLINTNWNDVMMNIIFNNTAHGILLYSETHCNNNTLSGNVIYNNTRNGITVESATFTIPALTIENTIENNVISENGEIGIAVINSSRNTFSNNDVYEHPIGIRLHYSDANNFYGIISIAMKNMAL